MVCMAEFKCSFNGYRLFPFQFPLHVGRTGTLQPAAACMILIRQPGQASSEVGANTVNQSYPNGGYYFFDLQGVG